MKYFIIAVMMVFLVLGLTCRADPVDLATTEEARTFLAPEKEGEGSTTVASKRVRRHGWGGRRREHRWEHPEHAWHHHEEWF